MKKDLVRVMLPLALIAAAAIATTLPQAQAELLFDADGDKLAENLEQLMLQSNDPLPVIVMLNQPATDAAVSDLEARFGFTAFARWDVIPGFAANLTPAQVLTLAQLPEVKQIEHDNPVYACLGTASSWYGATKARSDFGVDGNADGSSGYSKNDIVITILDTGIDAAHYDLDGGKVIGWKDYVNNRTTPYDDNGHGTHCASIAAGAGDANPTYKGVAPGAALVGVKVLNSSGSGTTTAIVNGINWVVSNKATYGIEVLSISLGSSGSSDGTDALSVACNNAVAAGIVVCVAAGNSGPKTYTIGSPAAAESPITVGAMSDCGEKGYFLAYFSSRGPTADGRIKPDVCGPGWNITAAKKGTTNQYTTMSGTSMATPFVAGIAALMLDANPALTPAQVKSYLQSTAQDWGPTGKDVDYGSGRSQAYEAVKAAGGYAGTGPVVPEHVYRADNLTAKGKTDIWQVNVNSTTYPIAVTMVMPSWTTSQDFDLYLYNPSGTQVAKSAGTTRQEYIGYTPTVTGNYKLYVKSYKGSGSYFFDLSCANAGSVTLVQNQFSMPEENAGAQAAGSADIAVVKAQPIGQGRAAFVLDLVRDGQVNVTLYDGAGRAVRSTSFTATKGENRVELSELAAGVYFYTVESQGLHETGKVAVVR